MKFNKWWGLLVGLIISIIVGFFLEGGYTEGNNLAVKNLVGLGIIVAGFVIGWWWENSQNDPKKEENK